MIPRPHRRHSLSTRLSLLFVGMAVLFLVLVGGAMSLAFRSHFDDNLRPHLARYLDYIRHDIGTPPDLAKAKAIAGQLAIDIHIYGPHLAWSSSGKPLPLEQLEYRREDDSAALAFGDYRGRHYLVSRQGEYSFAFAMPRGDHRWHWPQLLPLAMLLLVLALLHHATRRLFSPLQTLKAGIARIGAGELDHRIEVRCHNELGELAQSINTMADDIQQLLEAKRQLLLAISHELRAPLTRLKLAVEMLDDPAQQDELQHDLKEMETLIEELLETERLSGRHRALNKSDVSLDDLLHELLRDNFPAVALELELPDQEVRISVDSARLKLLVKNLLDNALRHNPADAPPPRLSLSLEPQLAVISVEDFGAGIEARHLPHLTEPFYRVDPSRRRETGGYGLGLYLCRVIAEAHGGRLAIHSEAGKGTKVSVYLPR